MSSSLDCWCDNCGSHSSHNPDGVNTWQIFIPPKHTAFLEKGEWVAVVFNGCRLHLCPSCWSAAKEVLSKQKLATGWGVKPNFKPNERFVPTSG